MTDSDPAVTIHTVGVHYRWELPEVLRAQLRLAHNLREDLVSLQLAYEDDLRTIWSPFPGVAAAESALQRAETAAAAAGERANSERIRLRKPNSQGAAGQRARGAPSSARRDHPSQRRRRCAPPRPSRPAGPASRSNSTRYCQDGDLYWGTYNFVFANHKTAVQRIRSRRLDGGPANLRHHRFDGTGTIAVQLQRTATTPSRTPALVADPAGRYRNVLVLPWNDPTRWAQMTRAEQRRAGRVTVRM